MSKLRTGLLLSLSLALPGLAAAQGFNLGKIIKDSLSSASCEKYKRWVASVPGAAANASVGRGGSDVVLSLVAEPVFSQAFGKSYRELTQSDFRAAASSLAECRRGGTLTPTEMQLTQQVWNEHMQVTLLRQQEALQAQRAELEGIRQELAALRPVEEDYARLDGLKARGDAAIRRGRTSIASGRVASADGGSVLGDLAAFEKEVEVMRQRVGVPVETQRVQAAVAAAEGSAGLQVLTGHLDRLRRSSLPATVVQGLRESLNKRITELAAGVAQQERQAIHPPRADLADLAAHAAAVRDFDNRNSRALNLAPPLAELQRALRAERQPLLAGAASEVARQVRGLREPEQISQLVTRYFLADELQAGPGAELKRMADQRAELLKRLSTDVAMFGAQPEHADLLAGTSQTGPAPTRCDQLAADPDDPGRIAPGVSDDDMNVAAAVQSCREAVKAEPRSGRLQFQLGRALLEDKKPQDAVAQFRRAAELQYPAAYFYLSEAYKSGMEGLPRNDKQASQYAKLAEKGGYGSGMSSSHPVFAEADYEDANMMQAVYYGNSSLLGDNGLYNFNYLVAQAQLLANECRSFKLSEVEGYRTAFVRGVIPGTTDGMARMGFEHMKNIATTLADAIRNPRSMVDNGAARQRVENAGMYGTRDLAQMWSGIGGCQAPQAKRYVKNLRHYLSRVGA